MSSEDDDPEELFREALEDLDGEDLREEKFDEEAAEPEEEWERELQEKDVESEVSDEREDASSEAHEPNAGGAKAMMEAALRDLDEEEIRERKFDDVDDSDTGVDSTGGRRDGSPGATEGHDESGSGESSSRSDAEARAELRRRRQRNQFEAAMTDVERLEESDKRREADPPDPDEVFEDREEKTDRSVEDFTTPSLPRSGDELDAIPPLDEPQQDLLDRFESSEPGGRGRELNLRGKTEREALHRVRNFTREAWERGERFIRIIPGRGKNSDGLPVLKLAVLEWLETDGAVYVRGYAPERQPGGSYGSLVVELLDGVASD